MDKVFLSFRYQEQSVRIIRDEAGDPWWVAADIGKIAGVKNVQDAVAILKDHEKRMIPGKLLGASYSTAKVLTVNASGLAHWVRRIPGAEAKKISTWCKQEHFPTLRKMGMAIAVWKSCAPKVDVSARTDSPREAVIPSADPQVLAEASRSLMAFQYQSHAVRVITGEDGEPWFVAVDVCTASELGAELNLRHSTGNGDGGSVNALLVRTGLASRDRAGHIVPAVAGAAWVHFFPIVGPRGVLPHQQVKWHSSVLPILRRALRVQQNDEARTRQGQLFPDNPHGEARG